MSDGVLDRLRDRARKQHRRILLPEHADPRVLEAAHRLAADSLAVPVLLDWTDSRPAPPGIEILARREDASEWQERAAGAFAEARAAKGMSVETAREQLRNPLLMAAALVRLGYTDGGVAGSLATTADVLRAGIQAIGLAQGVHRVSSAFLMELSDGRVLSYADCAVNPDPDPAALADIAIETAVSHERLTGEDARVALLSFATRGSAEHAMVDRVRAALAHARTKHPALVIDGELQFDAAFLPHVGQHKAPDSAVAGQANVYIFPDLNAGNIAYKITERLGGAKAIGPVLQGLRRPWMDLSRGCSADDIVDVAVIASVLASPN